MVTSEVLLQQKDEEFKKDFNDIEKKFRDSRKVIIPAQEKLEGEIYKRTKRGNIDAMRHVLKNWDKNLSEITTKDWCYKSLSTYKSYVTSYLKGEKGKCPRCFYPLIEEYKEYVEGFYRFKGESDTNLEAFEYLLNFWNDTLYIKNTFNLMPHTIWKWKWAINCYLRGERNKLLPEMIEILEKYKEQVLQEIAKSKDEDLKKERKLRAVESQKLADSNFETMLENYLKSTDILCEANRKLYTINTLRSFKASMYRYLNTGSTTGVITAHKSKIVEKYREELLNLNDRNKKSKSMLEARLKVQTKVKNEKPKVKVTQSKVEEKKAQPETKVEQPKPVAKEQIKEGIQKAITTLSKVPEKGETFVRFLEQLRDLGVKEFNLKF